MPSRRDPFIRLAGAGALRIGSMTLRQASSRQSRDTRAPDTPARATPGQPAREPPAALAPTAHKHSLPEGTKGAVGGGLLAFVRTRAAGPAFGGGVGCFRE